MQRPCQNPKISRSKYRGGGKEIQHIDLLKLIQTHRSEEEALYIKTAPAQIEAVHNNLNRDQC